MFGVLGLIGIVVLVVGFAVFFGLASEPPTEQPSTAARATSERSKFFDERLGPWSVRRDAEIPAEVLLSRLERHVRLEQAAVETYLHDPTPESLRRGTASPLVH